MPKFTIKDVDSMIEGIREKHRPTQPAQARVPGNISPYIKAILQRRRRAGPTKKSPPLPGNVRPPTPETPEMPFKDIL